MDNQGVRGLNLIWVVIDSVRNYHTDADDRGKLPVMDALASTGVEFTNVVTSAPSTIMSVSSMMTSWPAYYISRNYEDFKYDNALFTSLADILRYHGYSNEAVIFFREGREKLNPLFQSIARPYWPPDLRHGKKNWTNEDVSRVLYRFLDAEPMEPFFLYLHYNCRWDPQTSSTVEAALERMEAAGLLNRSVLVVCSDHGYPDPSRGFTPEGLKRQRLTHDLILTDDNILVPLYFQFPGCPVVTIDRPVSTLDIAPTALDLLGVPPSASDGIRANLRGSSLTPLLRPSTSSKHSDAKVRVDARLLGQDRRATAIRGRRFKYVVHHDRMGPDREELYDLEEDPHEQLSLAPSSRPGIQKKLVELRSEFERTEREAVEFQFRYLLEKLRRQLTGGSLDAQPSQIRSLLIFGACQPGFLAPLARVTESVFSAATVDVLVESELPNEGSIASQRCRVLDNRKKRFDPRTFPRAYSDLIPGVYDIVLVPLSNAHARGYSHILRIARRLKARKLLLLDYNMRLYYRRQRPWFFPFRVFWSKRSVYHAEPSLLVSDGFMLIKQLGRRIPTYFRTGE